MVVKYKGEHDNKSPDYKVENHPRASKSPTIIVGLFTPGTKQRSSIEASFRGKATKCLQVKKLWGWGGK